MPRIQRNGPSEAAEAVAVVAAALVTLVVALLGTALAPAGVAAFGAAILAASGTIYAGDVTGAIQTMTKFAESFQPSPAAAKRYDEIYGRFRQSCTRRGYGA